jgi:hypothetical protein
VSRRRLDPRSVAVIEAPPLEMLYISSVTKLEIRFGIELVADRGGLPISNPEPSTGGLN